MDLGSGSRGLPRVRRVEFPDGFSLDQVISLLYRLEFARGPLEGLNCRNRGGLPFAECGVSLRFVNGMKLQLLRTMCEDAGVELILLD